MSEMELSLKDKILVFLTFDTDEYYIDEFWMVHLQLWRFRAGRWKCLIGKHDWVDCGRGMFYCDSCPVEMEDGIIEVMHGGK